MRRERRPALVLTFPTTAAAMACEQVCEARGLPGRMIPVPGEISAGCGLAWKAAPGDRAALEAALAEEGVAVERWSVIELLEFVRDGGRAAGTGDGGSAPGTVTAAGIGDAAAGERP